MYDDLSQGTLYSWFIPRGILREKYKMCVEGNTSQSVIIIVLFLSTMMHCKKRLCLPLRLNGLLVDYIAQPYNH